MSKHERKIEWQDIYLFQEDTESVEDEVDEVEETNYLEQERNNMLHPIDFGEMKKLVQTPLGVFVHDDSYHPLRGLPVKVAHTNFDMTEEIVKALDEVAGIEAFKIIGRYRVIFIFGKMFNVDTVIEDISKAMKVNTFIIENIELDDLPESVQEVIGQIDKEITSDHWIAYIYPNKKYLVENLTSDEEAQKKYTEYKQLYNMSRGLVLSSAEIPYDKL